ncbi:heterogeneous nuclear ribonucleoprotein K isoform X2 [Galleria mellonella]|uniref:Heterogeneous nuclear ribonucleoprotein K isoform X2 n=1 Tax=Galleria mellonella TaxID=7137 RepID=A0A6J3BW38_GALME|nr:heterogeneous nuclear ribonucleoprotein K isoform X2 [Galleria mellonella]XP_031765613.1 heterogeneous nuclear ribonucleoprotein K isoform X2 [Galleria mellonella]XP_052755749.1 heterogeneous nuclear ribonucleoprotein K isoform X2 [Galleria mellonella]
MKRDAYGDDGPVHKRQRHTDNEVTFLIPSKVAGSIIGKGGANISKLRDQYKASITVPDCPGPERVLSITASDIDTILEIVKDILPNLADGGPNKGNNDDLDVRLLIHQSRAGCVIGKGGAKIKELREKTGARLKIFSNPAPQSTERVVQLVGKADATAAGIREVLELIRQVPIKGAIENYDPHNYDDFYADEYGGFGGGQGGGGRGGRGGPGPRGNRPPPPLGPGGRGPGPRGPMSRGGPPGPPPGPRSNFNDFGGPPPRGNFGGPPRGNFSGGNFGGNFGGGRSSGGGGNFNNNSGNQQETSTQVTIPKDLAGAIIGKAGSRIRKIRAESGAGIEIAEPVQGSNDRIITITGTPQRIQMAQYLLQQSVHESNPNLGRGNF